MNETPDAVYRDRSARFDDLAARLADRSRGLSRVRLAVAALVAAALVLVVRDQSWGAAVVAGAGLVVFLWLVVRHDRVEREHEAARAMASLNRDASARLSRAWDRLPAPWLPGLPADHAYAADLDVFGHASLAQVLGPVRTPTGKRTLTTWLLDEGRDGRPAITARQAAARELAPALDLRQRLTALARLLPQGPAEAAPDGLPHAVDWAESRDDPAPAWVHPLAVALTLATAGGAAGAFSGHVQGSWWLLTGAAGWLLRWWVRVPLEHAMSGAAGEHGLRPWHALIALVHGAPGDAPLLAQARADVAGAPLALRRLEQLVALADVRHNAWLFLPLQTLGLWDLHVWRAIDRWRRSHGADVRRWLEAVGRVEAVGSLASLAFDQPDWVFPVVDPVLDRLDAAAAGHPLLSDAVRVPNDVQVGPPGRFLLVTGSNMSGKSTLLRAIGLNIVLAQAGGPVCAASFRLPPLALHTSMRVSDSLELGLSLFMASLVRLRQIVDAARAASPARRVCYLLDEVLQGTNSAERQIAVRQVIGRLRGCEAIGAVTTHDLELARDPAFVDHADSFHLQETLSGDGADVSMTFDYRLRPGPAQTGNALQLLRMLGLSDT